MTIQEIRMGDAVARIDKTENVGIRPKKFVWCSERPSLYRDVRQRIHQGSELRSDIMDERQHAVYFDHLALDEKG